MEDVRRAASRSRSHRLRPPGPCVLTRYISSDSRTLLQRSPRPKVKNLRGSRGETWEPRCQGFPLPTAAAPEEQFRHPISSHGAKNSTPTRLWVKTSVVWGVFLPALQDGPYVELC